MPVEPWGAYPPEVNAGRFTSGGGPASWLATSLQWKAMAALVAEQIVVLEGITGALLNDWQGASGPATAAAFTPYKEWLMHMETIALENAAAADAVVSSFGGTLMGLVPVPVIAANRAAARSAESTAQAATVAAAVPGAAPVALGVAASATAAAAELEAQYSAMWGVNGAVMAGYDTAVTTATTPKVPLPPPPIVLDSLGGKAKTIQELIQKHGGSDNLVHSIEQQIQAGASQAQAQIAQAQQVMGSPAVQNGMQVAGPLFRSASAPFSSTAYTRSLMGDRPSSLSDSEFRSMLGHMSQSGGAGLRGMSSLSHGAGPGSLAAFSSGSGGHGSSLTLGSSSGGGSHGSSRMEEASLGLLGGAGAAAASTVFSGIPPTPPPAAPTMPAGGMMAPHGGMAGARGGEGGSKKAARVVDRDSFYDLIDNVRSTATIHDDAPIAAPTTGNANSEQRSRALVDKITNT